MGFREISPESRLAVQEVVPGTLKLHWARQILILAGPLPLHRTLQQRCRVMGEWQVAGSGDNDHVLLPHFPGLALNGRNDRVRSWILDRKSTRATPLAVSDCCGLVFGRRLIPTSRQHAIPVGRLPGGMT